MRRWTAVAACLFINGVFVHHLLAQHSTHGYLGVGVANITEERVKALKLKDDHGVVVMNVGDDTPAAKAGLKESDVITEFNGQPVDGVEQFTRLVRETPPNRKVTIRFIRDGVAQTANATLMAARALPPRVEGFEMPVPPTPPIPRMPWDERSPVSGWEFPIMSTFLWQQSPLGIELEQLNGQLAEYFGVKEGVLIRSVLKNSPSEKAGLKAGDVVTKVAGNPVKTPQQLVRQVQVTNAEKRPITLTTIRNHKEASIALKLPDEDDN